MNYKYLVRSCEVTSKNDGQRHFISCKQLIELYKVKPEECLLWQDTETWQKGRKKEAIQSLIYLHPQASGNYDLASCKTFGER